jgi:hypothetical protein
MSEPTLIGPCPACGNATQFIGTDDQMIGTQPFTVEADTREVVDYGAHHAPDIGDCTRVECAVCRHVLYDAYTDTEWLRGQIARLTAKLSEGTLAGNGVAPAIAAEVHSDDHHARAAFDAARWMRQADEADIRALDARGWGGDYAADAVAEFTRELNPDVELDEKMGFEVHIDETQARAWLRVHRPSVTLPSTDED